MISGKKTVEMLDIIDSMFPDAEAELNHDNTFELTIAVLLSAQATDNHVNKVTSSLFKKYKTPEDYVEVPLEELQNDIRTIGLFRNKAKNIQKLCRYLIDNFEGQVTESYEDILSMVRTRRNAEHIM